MHNPIFDGRTVFVIDVTKLCRGDILLTRNVWASTMKGTKSSDVIARLTKGDFSHALLCLSPPTFIEALIEGVSNLSVLNCFAFELSNVRLLRYPDREIAERATGQAHARLGQPYSKRSAAATIWPIRLRLNDGGIICSALIAEAYIAAKVPEFELLDLKKFTPATIQNLPFLEDVAADVFKPILSPANAEEMIALDGDRKARTSLKQGQILNLYHANVVEDVMKLRNRFPDCPRPNTFFDILSFIDAILSIATRHSLDPAMPHIQEARKIDAMLTEMISSGELLVIHDEMIKQDSQMHERVIRESFEIKPDFEPDHLAGILAVTRKTILETSSESQALKLWREMEVRQLGFLRQRERVLDEVLRRVNFSK